jgi:hypothetical protein
MGATQQQNPDRFRSAAGLLIAAALLLFLSVAPVSIRSTNSVAIAAAPMPSPAGQRPEPGKTQTAAVSKPVALASDNVRLVTPPPSKRPAAGIVFRGRPVDVAQAKAQLRQWLAVLKCPTQLVVIGESPTLDEVSFTLNTSADDSDTLTLATRLNWPMPFETIAFHDRNDVFQTRDLVSEAEVLAAMMQHGRAFLFAGSHCSVERLKEHVAIRRNIAYWGSRADWIFPDPFIPRYNADFWGALDDGEWTLKSGVSPHVAIADAFLGRPAYEVGCKSACQLVMAHGIFDYFAAVRPNLTLLAGIVQRVDPAHPLTEIAAKGGPQGIIRRPGRLVDRQFNIPWNHWVPGDWGWIKNTDGSSSNEICAEGSNVIYGGGGKFVNYYADGPLRTLDQSLKRVYGWRLGVEDGQIDLPDDVLQRLRGDPRTGGLLRDVRDVPMLFGTETTSPPEA